MEWVEVVTLSPGITGTATDPRFANYEEIQRHLSRRQAQHRWTRDHFSELSICVITIYHFL